MTTWRDGEKADGGGAQMTGDLGKVRRQFWPKIRRVLRHIPFARDAIAAYYCATDPATPIHVRGTLLAALVYFIVPFDLVPDFILGLGFADDASVLMAAFMAVRGNITPAHMARAEAALSELEAAAEETGPVIDGEIVGG